MGGRSVKQMLESKQMQNSDVTVVQVPHGGNTVAQLLHGGITLPQIHEGAKLEPHRPMRHGGFVVTSCPNNWKRLTLALLSRMSETFPDDHLKCAWTPT